MVTCRQGQRSGHLITPPLMRGLACTFRYGGVVVVVMVTCQQSQGQRSGIFFRYEQKVGHGR